MANPQWYDEYTYLNSKLAQLQSAGGINNGQPDTSYNNINDVKTAINLAGLTTYEHFAKYSLADRTTPNNWFSTDEYLAAKAASLNKAQGVTTWTTESVALALQNAGYTNAYDHFHAFGWVENINPSNDFDISDYLASKAAATGLTVAQVQQALVAAGQDPVQNWMAYGYKEAGVKVTPVPANELVLPEISQIFTLTTGQDTVIGTTENDIVNGFINADVAAGNTLNSGDFINGNGGLDTLNATIEVATTNPLYLNMVNVEKMVIRDFYGQTFNIPQVKGIDTVANQDSTGFTYMEGGSYMIPNIEFHNVYSGGFEQVHGRCHRNRSI